MFMNLLLFYPSLFMIFTFHSPIHEPINFNLYDEFMNVWCAMILFIRNLNMKKNVFNESDFNDGNECFFLRFWNSFRIVCEKKALPCHFSICIIESLTVSFLCKIITITLKIWTDNTPQWHVCTHTR